MPSICGPWRRVCKPPQKTPKQLGWGGVGSEVIHMSAATITSEPLGYNSIAQRGIIRWKNSAVYSG